MAKVSSSLVGFRGRVRDLVFRETKFGTLVSEFNSGLYEGKQWSDRQKLARLKFAGLCKLAQVFRKSNDLGFRSEMRYMSQPCFVRHNYTSLDVDSDGVYKVDYERVCMSHGTLSMLSEVSYHVVAGVLRVKWFCGEGAAGDNYDRVSVMLYCPDCKDSGINTVMGDGELSEGVVFRSQGFLEMIIPKRWAGLTVYSYVFVHNTAGRSSNSQYVGMFKAELPIVERTFEITGMDTIDHNRVFDGVEQRAEEVENEVKRCFVIKFRDDGELKEELLVEPTEDDDFVDKLVNGVRQPSQAAQITLRMRELIREVNPKLFEEKYSKGEEFRAESWDELCDIVTRAVMTGDG